MMSSKQNSKQHNLTDDGIQANIWDVLRKDETIRSLDLGSLSIKVQNGEVYSVVIQPDNRLVTHVVVRSKELTAGNLAARETVIPLEASDLVKNESIILQRDGRSHKAFPAFDPDEFPLAPFTWQAPYPYTAGEVRWSLREILEAANQPASQPELKPEVEFEQVSKQANSKAIA